MWSFNIDLAIVFVGLLWIAIVKFQLARMIPCVRWAFNYDVSETLIKSRLKTILSLVFSLLCLALFTFRFYFVLAAVSADLIVSYALPALVSLYGAYILFFFNLYKPIEEDNKAGYQQYIKMSGVGN